MKDKAEKTRGAKVRASRARSRVEANRRPRAVPRAPGRGPTQPARVERGGERRGAAETMAAPAAAGTGRAAERGRRQEKATPRERETARARAVVLGGVLAVSLAAMLWVYTGTGVLNVKQVEFTGNGKLRSDYLHALCGISGDTHLLKMDVKAVERALLSEPYVARADIVRHFPNRVKIAIVERQPCGYVSQNGRYVLVDQEGMVLESAEALPPGLVEIKDLALPLLLPGSEVTGLDFAAVTSLMGSLPQALREKTAAVGLRGGGGLYITAGGTTVIYGEAKDFSRKNTIALMALSLLVQRYGAVEYIDVSYPDHPVIKPSGAA